MSQDELLEQAQALIVQGEQDRRVGEYAQAIERLNECLQLPLEASPERNLLLYHALVCRGAVHLAEDRTDDAIADCSAAIGIDPERALAFCNRGHAWRAKQQWDQAIDDYSRAIELDPNYAESYLHRGQVWEQLNQPAEAKSDAESYVRLLDAE